MFSKAAAKAELVRLGEYVVERSRADERWRHTADVVVMHEGEVIFASHRDGDRLRPVFSITKTLTALLVGVAVDRGLCGDICHVVEEPNVTVSDLLSMQRGAVCDVEDIDRVRELSGGWQAAMRAMRHDVAPGSTFRYDNCAYELAGYWLTEQSGRTLEDLAAEHLFAPLGISEWRWDSDPEGMSWGSDGVWLRARDVTSLGHLLLQRGTHRGARIVSEEWIDMMCARYSTGGPPEQLPYGYGVWIAPDRLLLGGWAGQHVSIIRAASVVVTTTGDADLLAQVWLPARRLVEDRWPIGGPLRGGEPRG